MADTDVVDRPAPVFGIDDSIKDSLGSLPTVYSDLPASTFDDRQFTIVGFSEKAGGEQKIDETSGREYVTNDQWLVFWRADDEEAAAILADSGGILTQYLTLPRAVTGPNGVKRRPKPTRHTQTGIFIGALDAIGVSGDPQSAHVLHLKDWSDAIGLSCIRRRQAYELPGRNARTLEIDVPVQVVGVDNEFRKSVKLNPVTLKLDRPELNT